MSPEFTWPELGAHVARLRKEQKLTLKQVQAATGLTKPTLIRAERGKDVQLSTLHAMLQLYGGEVHVGKSSVGPAKGPTSAITLS